MLDPKKKSRLKPLPQFICRRGVSRDFLFMLIDFGFSRDT